MEAKGAVEESVEGTEDVGEAEAGGIREGTGSRWLMKILCNGNRYWPVGGGCSMMKPEFIRRGGNVIVPVLDLGNNK